MCVVLSAVAKEILQNGACSSSIFTLWIFFVALYSPAYKCTYHVIAVADFTVQCTLYLLLFAILQQKLQPLFGYRTIFFLHTFDVMVEKHVDLLT